MNLHYHKIRLALKSEQLLRIREVLSQNRFKTAESNFRLNPASSILLKSRFLEMMRAAIVTSLI